MLVPVRCFSCNKVIGGHYEQFIERRENGEDPGEVMDDGLSNLEYEIESTEKLTDKSTLYKVTI